MPEMRPPKILVIQPDILCDLHRFEGWLVEGGAELDVVRPFDGDLVPSSVEADALVVLGGSMGANDSADFPWLATIGSLMRSAVVAEKPTLGICLGAQILADALGGEVRRGDEGVELGVTEVSWGEAAGSDPLVAGLPGPLLAGSFHFDAIVRLPEGAVRLGTGATYENQAFRFGSAWGVQFHPEVSPERFRSWRDEVQSDADAIAYFDEQAREFDEVDAEVVTGTQALAANFSRIVRRSMDTAG